MGTGPPRPSVLFPSHQAAKECSPECKPWAQGFPILGATFVEDPKALQGLRPPDFCAMSLNNKRLAARDARQRWREVAFAAGKSGHMPLMDLTSRIASVYRYSQMRLYYLATAYSLQLRNHLHEGRPKNTRHSRGFPRKLAKSAAAHKRPLTMATAHISLIPYGPSSEPNRLRPTPWRINSIRQSNSIASLLPRTLLSAERTARWGTHIGASINMQKPFGNGNSAASWRAIRITSSGPSTWTPPSAQAGGRPLRTVPSTLSRRVEGQIRIRLSIPDRATLR